MSTYCFCFDVEGERFDGRDKKYIICIDPVGNTSWNVGVAGHKANVKRRRESNVIQFNGTSHPQRGVFIDNLTLDEKHCPYIVYPW